MLADVVNRLTDDEIPRWAADHPILIRLPAYKFVLGVAGYLSLVIIVTWRTFLDYIGAQIFTLVFGLASMAALLATALLLLADDLKAPIARASVTTRTDGEAKADGAV